MMGEVASNAKSNYLVLWVSACQSSVPDVLVTMFSRCKSPFKIRMLSPGTCQLGRCVRPTSNLIGS
jgi:hypothetical protein